MSDTQFRLIYADRTEVLELPSGNAAVDAEAARLTLTVEDGVHTIALTPRRDDLRLVALEYEMPLPAGLFDPADQLLIYNNSAYTNDVSSVTPYSDESRDIRELCVCKNQKNRSVRLIGFLTSFRFWTTFRMKDRRMTVRFELEERLLDPAETYIMERFLILDGVDNEHDLLLNYADRVDAFNHTKELANAPLPVGWCSWSCYYTKVNEEKIRRAADSQKAYGLPGVPNLIQIDDGWQTNGSFCGEWVVDPEKFPSGMKATSQYVNDRGMVFGLWLAPMLLNEESTYYENLKHLSMPERTLGTSHPFDLSNPAFHEHLRKTFRRMVDEFGARYFKLDFLAASARHFNNSDEIVRFPGGFSIECLRSAMQTIRDTVGPDVFLLSCGAPMLAGAGIFNGARMSCDIIWGPEKFHPTYYQIMQNCLRTVGSRNFYHRRVFVNDPDGLVLRDVNVGDGFNCTYSEAELWSVAVAMSGGLLLSNDELEKLSPGRRRLFTQVQPPLDRACRPLDYFEMPAPTAYILPIDENTLFLALYHFGDKIDDVTFDLDRVGMKGALVADCLKNTFLGFRDTISVENVAPHSGLMFLLRKPAAEPAFVGAASDIYMGIHRYTSTYADGHLTVTRPENAGDAAVYALYPAGFTPEGETVLTENGYTLTRLP